jgi:hypothetical protein
MKALGFVNALLLLEGQLVVGFVEGFDLKIEKLNSKMARFGMAMAIGSLVTVVMRALRLF